MKKIKMTKPEMAKNAVDGWNVEQFGDDGECFMATFTGPYAEERATYYMALAGAAGNYLSVASRRDPKGSATA